MGDCVGCSRSMRGALSKMFVEDCDGPCILGIAFFPGGMQSWCVVVGGSGFRFACCCGVGRGYWGTLSHQTRSLERVFPFRGGMPQLVVQPLCRQVFPVVLWSY